MRLGPDSVNKITKEILSGYGGHCSFHLRGASRVIDMSHTRLLEQNGDQRDRRTKRRFQIEQEIRYKMLYGQRIAETGTGKTINISSGGVCFTTETMLTPGMPIELSMNWPVLLNDSCPMKLMIYGCVIRTGDKGAAVAIERYEFRTQGSRNFQSVIQQQPAEYRV